MDTWTNRLVLRLSLQSGSDPLKSGPARPDHAAGPATPPLHRGPPIPISYGRFGDPKFFLLCYNYMAVYCIKNVKADTSMSLTIINIAAIKKQNEKKQQQVTCTI